MPDGKRCNFNRFKLKCSSHFPCSLGRKKVGNVFYTALIKVCHYYFLDIHQYIATVLILALSTAITAWCYAVVFRAYKFLTEERLQRKQQLLNREEG
jgi:hypothetical protein